MNLEIDFKQKHLLLEAINLRIKYIDKLIKSFDDIELITHYVNDRQALIELSNRLL